MRTSLLVVVLTVVSVTACSTTEPVFPQLLQARRLASELHVEFTKASDAANRAVMAETDEASMAAAREAKQARRLSSATLRRYSRSSSHSAIATILRYLDGFTARFDEYRRLDDEILPLAVENTNVKAQRLSFGPARETAEIFEPQWTRQFVRAALRTRAASSRWRRGLVTPCSRFRSCTRRISLKRKMLR